MEDLLHHYQDIFARLKQSFCERTQMTLESS